MRALTACPTPGVAALLIYWLKADFVTVYPSRSRERVSLGRAFAKITRKAYVGWFKDSVKGKVAHRYTLSPSRRRGERECVLSGGVEGRRTQVCPRMEWNILLGARASQGTYTARAVYAEARRARETERIFVLVANPSDT